jgi:hypothetical protein
MVHYLNEELCCVDPASRRARNWVQMIRTRSDCGTIANRIRSFVIGNESSINFASI